MKIALLIVLLLVSLFAGFIGLVLAELGGEHGGAARDSARVRAFLLMLLSATGCAVFGWAL